MIRTRAATFVGTVWHTLTTLLQEIEDAGRRVDGIDASGDDGNLGSHNSAQGDAGADRQPRWTAVSQKGWQAQKHGMRTTCHAALTFSDGHSSRCAWMREAEGK